MERSFLHSLVLRQAVALRLSSLADAISLLFVFASSVYFTLRGAALFVLAPCMQRWPETTTVTLSEPLCRSTSVRLHLPVAPRCISLHWQRKARSVMRRPPIPSGIRAALQRLQHFFNDVSRQLFSVPIVEADIRRPSPTRKALDSRRAVRFVFHAP